MPPRPKSIVQFDAVYLAIIVLGLVNTVLSWEDLTATVDVQRLQAQVGAAPLYVTAFFGVAIQLLLWYFIARRGSVVAKWIFVVLTVAGLGLSALSLAGGGAVSPLVGVIGVVLLVLQAIALWLLFRPDAGPWFGEEGAGA